MPRVALSAEQKREHKLRDFKGWVTMQMKLTGKTQAEVGRALGISWASAYAMRTIRGGRGGKAAAPDIIGAGKEEVHERRRGQ